MTKQAAKIHIFMAQKTFLYFIIYQQFTNNIASFSIMLSSPPKTSQTHISVIQTPVTMIFLPVGTSHLVTHPRFLQVEHA